MCFFFLLSGFVLAWSARDEDSPRQFWRRRAARILPAYAVAWVIGVLYEAHRNGAHAMRWLQVLPGFFLLQSWFASSAIHFGGDGVAWSLSCEAFFYLSLPLLHRSLARLADNGLTAVLIGALAASVLIPAIVRSPNPDYYWVYVFPPTRMLEFVAGISIAILIRRGHRCPVPLGSAILIALAAYGVACAGPVWSAQVSVMAAPYALLIASAASDELGPRPSMAWLRSRVLVTLGTWSYAFYLLHQMVYNAVIDNSHVRRHEAVGLALVLSIAGAGLLYTVIERPLERRFRTPRTARRADEWADQSTPG